MLQVGIKDGFQWKENLSNVLLALHSTPHSTTKETPLRVLAAQSTITTMDERKWHSNRVVPVKENTYSIPWVPKNKLNNDVQGVGDEIEVSGVKNRQLRTRHPLEYLRDYVLNIN